MAKRRRSKTSGLGRAPAKGRGKFCVTTRKASGAASTVCYTNGNSAMSAFRKVAMRQRKKGGGNEVVAAMLYKRSGRRRKRRSSR